MPLPASPASPLNPQDTLRVPTSNPRPIRIAQRCRGQDRDGIARGLVGVVDEDRDRVGADLEAQPFQWRFTTTDLDDLLARIERHVPDQQAQSSLDRAA